MIVSRSIASAENLRLPSYVAPSYDDGTITLIDVKVAKNVKFHDVLITEEGRAVVYTVHGTRFGSTFDPEENPIAFDRGDGIWRLPLEPSTWPHFE
jgi:hypothetical protein